MGLEEWIQGIEEIFTVVEVLEDKKVNIRTFYLTVEADIWWKVVKDMLLGHDFTWTTPERTETQILPNYGSTVERERIYEIEDE